MKCPQCQTENESGHRFCAQCGAPLVDPAPTAAGAAPADAARAPAPRTFPMLPVVIAGAAVLVLGFLAVVGAGAYLLLRHQNAAPQTGPATPPGAPQPQAGPATPAAPIPPPPGAQQPAGGAQPQAPQQSTLPMDSYAIGKLVVKYPSGWHVLASQVSGYVFYKDEPHEGTAFTVLPLQTVGGEMGAPQVLQNAAGGIFGRRYRDFRVSNVSVNAVQSDLWGAGQVSEADAAWTGARQQPMQARLWAFSLAGTGATTFLFMAGQAPAAEFDQWRNVFEEMFLK